jgi:hypothetical protein
MKIEFLQWIRQSKLLKIKIKNKKKLNKIIKDIKFYYFF